MPRFYLPQLPNQGELALPESIVRHIHVLRLQAGDEIVLFDGRGMRVAATLRQVEKRKAACTTAGVSAYRPGRRLDGGGRTGGGGSRV